ncbi:MAG: Gx transporter family protein [Clostridia bacterium]|nr:Gx transporter family protein [Clostridia bacterium]
MWKMPHGKISTKRIAVCGLLISLALIFGFVEKLIPFEFLTYGFKIGFANIVVVFALYKLNTLDAFVVSFFKIVLCAISFGGPVYLFYSLSGGLLSFVVMLLLKNKLHVVTVSILGSVFFNIGQIVCASILLSTNVIYSYLPVLMVVGIITGAVIGLISNTAINRIKI